MAEYRRQHLVSQVVQRRFTRESGPAAKRMFGLSRSAPEQLQEARPRSSLKEDWFIDAHPGRFEQAWGDIESRASTALTELQRLTAAMPVATETEGRIVDLMALHLVRSVASKRLWERGRGRVVSSRRASMLQQRALLELARASAEFEPGASDEDIVDAITSRFEDPLRAGGTAFGETLIELYESVRDHFSSMHLEIGEAAGDEFLLPDVAVVPFDAAGTRAGLLAGVGIFQADAIVMPMGPRHIASLTTRAPVPAWLSLSAEQVLAVNRVLALVADDAVFFRPALDERDQQRADFIRSVWSEPGPTGSQA